MIVRCPLCDQIVPNVDQSGAPHLPDSLIHLLHRLLPDELFGEVMQGMVDPAWLRERAETVAASGDPFSNEKAAALFEAADAAAASGSPDAAP